MTHGAGAVWGIVHGEQRRWLVVQAPPDVTQHPVPTAAAGKDLSGVCQPSCSRCGDGL